MELEILRLIKFLSCRQSFALLFPLVIHGVEKAGVHPPYCLIRSSSSCSRKYERDVKKGGEKKKTVTKMTGRCQNNSPAVIFVQRGFNMVTEMHIQYS